MKSLLIIGAGGYGRLVKELAELLGYEKIDFLDDNSPLAVGKVQELEILQNEYDGTIVAIGNPAIREKLFRKVKRPVSIIHPSAVISPSAQIGEGCVIEAGTVINTAATVQNSCFICAGAVVNHNAEVEEFCQIDCNAVVGSGMIVPSGTKVESCTVYTI